MILLILDTICSLVNQHKTKGINNHKLGIMCVYVCRYCINQLFLLYFVSL